MRYERKFTDSIVCIIHRVQSCVYVPRPCNKPAHTLATIGKAVVQNDHH
jgi:hypothetical protein